MSGFPMLTVNDLVNAGEAAIQTGPFGTQLAASEYVHDGIPVINVRNIGFGRIRAADLEFLNESKAYDLRKHQLKVGDIVFGRKGAVERHVLIDQHADGWIQGSDCLRLRLSGKRVHPRFLSYFFTTKAHQDWMQALCSFGATMSSLNQDIVKRISFPCPPLETQRKIAGILSAYDDLIENKRRRIAILERMAEELYREWFVRMRFPGYQNTKFIKGVPEGWEVLSFDRAVDLKPDESLHSGELYPFVPMEQLSCTSMYFDYAEKRKSPSGPRFRNGDVLFPRITPSVENGKRGFVSCLADDEIGIGSTEFIVMRKKKISAEHIYFLTISKEFRTHAEQSMVGASGRQRVHEKCFSSFLVQTPCESVRKRFETSVRPIFRQISLLAKTAKDLERHRTLLLGRLISARCPVEHLNVLSPKQLDERSEQTVTQEVAHA